MKQEEVAEEKARISVRVRNSSVYNFPHLHIMVSFSFSIITLELFLSSHVATCLISTYI